MSSDKSSFNNEKLIQQDLPQPPNQDQDEETQTPEDKIKSLQRANQILIKAREIQYKKTQYLKTKFEKRQAKFKSQIELLQNQLAEKDKVFHTYFFILFLGNQTVLVKAQRLSKKPCSQSFILSLFGNRVTDISKTTCKQ